MCSAAVSGYREPVRLCGVLPLVVAAGAIVLGSAASGARGAVAQPSLALMPLPKSSLGSTALSLPLDSDSGVQSNADAAGNANGNVTAAQLDKLGRITGYQLDYNDAAAHALAVRRGLLEVVTSVELYRSAAAARSGLAFWRKDATDLAKLRAVGVSASVKAFRASGLPSPSYAATAVLKIPGKPKVYGIMAEFATGPLVAQVSVTAADAADRRGYAVSLAKQLATRIRDVLAGRVAGPPVPLPGTAKAGPPPNGPDLALLTLSPTDLGGGTIKQQGYKLDKDLSPVSEYARTMSPAGPFLVVEEEVVLLHSATEAGIDFTILGSALQSQKALSLFGPTSGITSYHPARVTVHGGDEARAIRATVGVTGGQSVNEAMVLIRTGAALELVIVGSPGTVPIPVGQIQGLAAAAASRAAAGLAK
jgi:hypothetical protein